MIVGGLAACGEEQPTSGPQVEAATIEGRADFQWVIPKGTAAKVDSATHDAIFPAVLYAKVGQTVRIINEDSIGYTIGPFSVGPNQTLEQVLRRPGEFQGICSTHRGATFVLIVE